jgi:hypothetical protein
MSGLQVRGRLRGAEPHLDAAALGIDRRRDPAHLRVEHLLRVRVGGHAGLLSEADRREVALVGLEHELRAVRVRREHEERARRLHDVAGLDAPREDDAVLGRHDLRLREADADGGELRLGLEQRRERHAGVGALGGGGDLLRQRGGLLRAREIDGPLRVVELRLRQRAARRELLGPLEIRDGVIEVRLRLTEARRRDDGADPAELLGARARLGDGGLRLDDLRARLRVVHAQEDVSGADVLAFDDEDGQDEAGSLRRHLHPRRHPHAAARHEVLLQILANGHDGAHLGPARAQRHENAPGDEHGDRDPEAGAAEEVDP